MTDDTLVEALLRGEREAVGALFDRHYDELFAFADRFAGDADLAADAVQETFLRVLRYGRSYSGRSSLRTWLLQVARNVCLDMLKARSRERTTTSALPPPEPVPPPPGPDPRLARLREALASLPDGAREALILRRFHDLTYAEIGELCGISEGTARVRAHRALERLRDQLSRTPEVSRDR